MKTVSAWFGGTLLVDKFWGTLTLDGGIETALPTYILT